MELDQAATLRNGHGDRMRTLVPRRLRCIAVGSGKGGVGKTMVSIGLCSGLVRRGYRVLILDADLGLANVDLQMGMDPVFTLQDVVMGSCSLKDAVMSSSGGPDVLAAASGAPELVDMGSARREMLVNDLMKFAAAYDYLVIDVGAGIGDSATAFLGASPEVLVVVANEPTSIMDAYSLIKVLTRGKRPPAISLVANMVRSVDEGELLVDRLNGITQRFLRIQLPLAGVITYDETVRSAIQARTPVLNYAPGSAPAKCLEELTGFVVSNRRNSATSMGLEKSFFESLTRIGNPELNEAVEDQVDECSA